MFREEVQEVYAAEFLYREIACYQNARQRFRESYPAFNKAVELAPTDLRALLGRSVSRAKGGHYACALDDVARTLKAHPGDLRAVQAQAVYTFLRTDFEEAMMMNQRGSFKRKQPDTFIMGVLQEILHTRQPFYAIKYSEVTPTGNFLLRELEHLKQAQIIVKQAVDILIKQLRVAREGYNTNTAVAIADKAKTYMDKMPHKILSDKERYLRQLYDLIGLVHLDKYRLKEKEDWDPKYRINFLFGLPISREPSQDSVIKNNKRDFMLLRSAIERAVGKTERRLAKATTPLETVWLYYDLARFSLDLKKYDLSRFYSRKALNMAIVLNNNVWATNVNMLISSAHVIEQNKNEAKNELNRTLVYAKELKCKDIISYIQKCIDEVDLIDFDVIDIQKVIEARERAMVQVLVDKDTKKDIQVLFMRIDAIPGSRRMSIMPGLRFEDSDSPRKAESKASIKPKSAIELEFQRQLPQKKGLELLDID